MKSKKWKITNTEQCVVCHNYIIKPGVNIWTNDVVLVDAGDGWADPIHAHCVKDTDHVVKKGV